MEFIKEKREEKKESLQSNKQKEISLEILGSVVEIIRRIVK